MIATMTISAQQSSVVDSCTTYGEVKCSAQSNRISIFRAFPPSPPPLTQIHPFHFALFFFVLLGIICVFFFFFLATRLALC